MTLGGIAAEIVVFAVTAQAAAHDRGLRFAESLDLLTDIEASGGMGHRLMFSAASDADEADRLRRFDPRLAMAVETGLQKKNLSAPRPSLSEERALFDAMCDALAEKSRLDALQVGELVDALRPVSRSVSTRFPQACRSTPALAAR